MLSVYYKVHPCCSTRRNCSISFVATEIQTALRLRASVLLQILAKYACIAGSRTVNCFKIIKYALNIILYKLLQYFAVELVPIQIMCLSACLQFELLNYRIKHLAVVTRQKIYIFNTADEIQSELR